MPELPEIEVIRRTLAPRLLGARLRIAHIGMHDMRARGKGRATRTASAARTASTARTHAQRGTWQQGTWMSPAQLLDGACVAALHRHGKQLAIEADDGRVLVVQLGMSGQLLVEPVEKPASTGKGNKSRALQHRHLVWSVERRGASAMHLVMRDPRRFGGVHHAESMRQLRASAWAPLGPDALTVSAAELMPALKSARNIKAVLLDQTRIAGVGNIYADESLFRARIPPRLRASRITPHVAAELVRALRFVLRRAVAHGGSTISDHVSADGESGHAQDTHAVYGRAGLPCIRCGTLLQSAHIAGRTTVWCPVCQDMRAKPLLRKRTHKGRRSSERRRVAPNTA